MNLFVAIGKYINTTFQLNWSIKQFSLSGDVLLDCLLTATLWQNVKDERFKQIKIVTAFNKSWLTHMHTQTHTDKDTHRHRQRYTQTQTNTYTHNSKTHI